MERPSKELSLHYSTWAPGMNTSRPGMNTVLLSAGWRHSGAWQPPSRGVWGLGSGAALGLKTGWGRAGTPGQFTVLAAGSDIPWKTTEAAGNSVVKFIWWAQSAIYKRFLKWHHRSVIWITAIQTCDSKRMASYPSIEGCLATEFCHLPKADLWNSPVSIFLHPLKIYQKHHLY